MYYIRRKLSVSLGLYAVSIGIQKDIPVLAWVDNVMHAQKYPQEVADRIMDKLLRNGPKVYKAHKIDG